MAAMMSINAVAPVRTSRGHSPRAREDFAASRDASRRPFRDGKMLTGARSGAAAPFAWGFFATRPGSLGAPGRRERRRTGASIAETPTGVIVKRHARFSAPRRVRDARSARVRAPRAIRQAGSYRDGRSDRLPPPPPTPRLHPHRPSCPPRCPPASRPSAPPSPRYASESTPAPCTPDPARSTTPIGRRFKAPLDRRDRERPEGVPIFFRRARSSSSAPRIPRALADLRAALLPTPLPPVFLGRPWRPSPAPPRARP